MAWVPLAIVAGRGNLNGLPREIRHSQNILFRIDNINLQHQVI